jgi:hypothetical protein
MTGIRSQRGMKRGPIRQPPVFSELRLLSREAIKRSKPPALPRPYLFTHSLLWSPVSKPPTSYPTAGLTGMYLSGKIRLYPPLSLTNGGNGGCEHDLLFGFRNILAPH